MTEQTNTALAAIAVRKRVADNEVKFYADKVDSEIRWLEGAIRDLRREVERGQVFEQRNLVAKAADVADSAHKLHLAQETARTLAELAKEVEG